jgi:hypothetical protein
MGKMTQKEAVFEAVVNVVTNAGITFEEGMNVAPHMSRELRAQVNQILVEGFKAGSIELDTEFDEANLKRYVSGLQSNWLRKDKRLNGSVKYVAKNPGSRAGSGDTQLKALRALKAHLESKGEDTGEIDSFIEKRVSEISTAKRPTIDVSSLPAELRKYVG